MKVINQSRVDFQYKLYSKGTIIAKTIFSNTVATVITKDVLKAKKQVDKTIASGFDILTYTITISNISNNNITNVFFQDLISEDVKFINNSIKINGAKKRCVNPKDGFNIGTIETCSSLIISFKVVVLPRISLHNINNYSELTYDYIYNVEMPPTRVTIKTNEVCTMIENRLFKQFNVNNTLKISSKFPLIDSIEHIKIKINILKTKIIETPIVSTNNNYKSNLCSLIVIGNIEYDVLYKYKCVRQERFRVKRLTDIKGFSTFMLVPYGIQYCSIDNLKILVESISDIMLNEEKLFVDIEMLMDLFN